MTLRPRPLRTLDDFIQDVRYGIRQLRRAPVFTVTALLTLALGIGGAVAILTLADIVLLRPLPYAEPDRLVEIDDVYAGRRSGVGQAEFDDWVATADQFERLALAEFDGAILRTGGRSDPERIVGNRVTDGFFDVLGAKPLYGRTFRPGEDLPFRGQAIVLSHALWRRSFGGDPNVIGTKVLLGETLHEVAGVMPPSFFWIQSRTAEFWRPLGYRSSGRMQHQYSAVGRLRRGATLGSAQAQMDGLARRAEEQYAAAKGWRISVLPLGHDAAAAARTPLGTLALAAALVLLIACANVATLLAVRAAARSKEIATRASLGATRGRLARQFFVEGALLASIGGGSGLMLAGWMLGALVPLVAPGIGLPASIALDYRALALSVTLTGVTAVIFAHAGAPTGRPQHRFLRHVVAGEVALATVLLIAAVLLITSLARLFTRDLGFQPERVLTFEVQLPARGYERPRRVVFFDELVGRVNGLPGVEAAAATSALPMSRTYSGSGFEIDGRAAPAEWRQQSAQASVVSAGYFHAMGIAILRGRSFSPLEPAPIVIISETLARAHWPDQDPVGRRIRYRGGREWMTIAGVAADTRYAGPRQEPNPTIYLPHDVTTAMPSMFIAVRLRPRSGATMPALRRVVRDLDPSAAVTRVATLDELTERSLAVERSMGILLGAFAIFAMVLAAIGSYGVIAHSVQQRTREMGIRLALGADAAQVRNMVLWQGVRAALAGVVAGVALALGVTRFIASFLFGVTARDPLVFAAVPVLLSAVAFLSVWLPALRAARVEPAVALRAE